LLLEKNVGVGKTATNGDDNMVEVTARSSRRADDGERAEIMMKEVKKRGGGR
jgi:hypothetical protein